MDRCGESGRSTVCLVSAIVLRLPLWPPAPSGVIAASPQMNIDVCAFSALQQRGQLSICHCQVLGRRRPGACLVYQRWCWPRLSRQEEPQVEVEEHAFLVLTLGVAQRKGG